MTRKVTNICLLVLVLGLAGCSGMTTRQQNAAVGAGIGGLAGAILTHGSAFGTVGGAAIGGVIGHGVDNLTGGSSNSGSTKKKEDVAKK